MPDTGQLSCTGTYTSTPAHTFTRTYQKGKMAFSIQIQHVFLPGSQESGFQTATTPFNASQMLKF